MLWRRGERLQVKVRRMEGLRNAELQTLVAGQMRISDCAKQCLFAPHALGREDPLPTTLLGSGIVLLDC
jgi:hypothetical protein